VKPVSLGEATRVWARIALLSFGGPAGQIAVMHRILVEEKRWIGEARFLHALNYCMLLPGPEAQQLATYIGWLLHRTRGGLVAGGLFILPGLIAIMLLSWIYALFGQLPAMAGLFFGLRAAVLAIVLDAVRRIGARTLRDGPRRLIAGGAFVGIFLFALPFPVIILAAALAGLGLEAMPEAAGAGDAGTLLGEELPDHARSGVRHTLTVASLFLLLWLAPVALLAATLGPGNDFSRIAIFFSKLALVTFGGAYAVLSYVAQQAVGAYHWLAPGEMLDGLGMAETTPGPLIMVTQFVGFMAGFRHPGGLPPLLAGTLGGLLTTWVTFTPCFLWIFAGAPFVERLRGNRAASAALSGITAAVVGVILNLAVWFAVHSLFRTVRPLVVGPLRFDAPDLASLDPAAALLSAAAVFAVFRFRVGTLPLLGACAAAGLAWRLLAG
jgi:chromate transporter